MSCPVIMAASSGYRNIYDIAERLKRRISVIPAKAGIQLFQILKNSLDSGFHRSDDFLRFHQYLCFKKIGEPEIFLVLVQEM